MRVFHEGSRADQPFHVSQATEFSRGPQETMLSALRTSKKRSGHNSVEFTRVSKSSDSTFRKVTEITDFCAAEGGLPETQFHMQKEKKENSILEIDDADIMN